VEESTFTEPEFLRGLEGSPEAKKRLTVILEFLTGKITFEEGCARLGVNEPEFDQLVTDAGRGMLEQLENLGDEESASST